MTENYLSCNSLAVHSNPSSLTDRQREILQLIAEGKSTKEIASTLFISIKTVEVHRARVMEKLGARNTADLMRIVLTS